MPTSAALEFLNSVTIVVGLVEAGLGASLLRFPTNPTLQYSLKYTESNIQFRFTQTDVRFFLKYLTLCPDSKTRWAIWSPNGESIIKKSEIARSCTNSVVVLSFTRMRVNSHKIGSKIRCFCWSLLRDICRFYKGSFWLVFFSHVPQICVLVKNCPGRRF